MGTLGCSALHTHYFSTLSKPYRRPHRWITSAFQVSTARIHFLNSIGREFCSCLVLNRKGRKVIKKRYWVKQSRLWSLLDIRLGPNWGQCLVFYFFLELQMKHISRPFAQEPFAPINRNSTTKNVHPRLVMKWKLENGFTFALTVLWRYVSSTGPFAPTTLQQRMYTRVLSWMKAEEWLYLSVAHGIDGAIIIWRYVSYTSLHL